MISGRVSGDSEVLLFLKSRGLVLRDELRTTVQRQGFRLLRIAKEKVSGPVLKNRTGTLRRKINFVLRETADAIAGSLGIKLSYAPPHEYGFEGVVSVKAHLRMITKAWGRPLAAPVAVQVHEHPRNMKVPERSFLRSTLRENAPSVREALQLATGPSLA